MRVQAQSSQLGAFAEVGGYCASEVVDAEVELRRVKEEVYFSLEVVAAKLAAATSPTHLNEALKLADLWRDLAVELVA